MQYIEFKEEKKKLRYTSLDSDKTLLFLLQSYAPHAVSITASLSPSLRLTTSPSTIHHFLVLVLVVAPPPPTPCAAPPSAAAPSLFPASSTRTVVEVR